MKSNELRLGNIVRCNDVQAASYFIMKKSHFVSMLENETEYFYWVEPIPLTKEWLLKFGFEKSNSYNNFRVKAEKNYYHSVKEYKGKWIYSNDDSDAACYTVASIEYVHQLQNLYFALTGEELNIL